jgi:DNA-binding transcriptional MerR regulator
MEGLPVDEVARLAGLTVRTLHYWDAVGLLVPSGRTASGYRLYGSTDLERLTRLLSYRELGFGLEQVARLLDDPDVDAVEHLRRQHALLVDRIARLQAVAALVQTMMEAKRMGVELDPQEIHEVFGDDDPTLHAQEAEQRWGDTDAWRESHRRTSTYNREDWLHITAAQEDLEERFARALRRGVPARAREARDLAEEHRRHLCQHFYDVDHQVHRGLADLYVEDERFAAPYDRRHPGLAQYIADAVRANAAARQPHD